MATDEPTVSDLWNMSKLVFYRGCKRYMFSIGAAGLFFLILFSLAKSVLHGVELPAVSLDYNESLYNASKVALLVENRPDPILAPLIIHMMSVLPQDWRFQFLGSEESVEQVLKSAAIRRQIESGKLYWTLIPPHISVAGQELISQFFTNLWVYENLILPAEWLLVYQTDSIVCANSLDSVNNYLEYDWVGAPWDPSGRYGGNGGLSMRRVSSIIRVLEHQQRVVDSDPEDVWLTERLGHLPDTTVANGSMSFNFSAEGWYVHHPMGYHIGGSGKWLASNIWGTEEKRQELYDWCPEMKIEVEMDAAGFFEETCDDPF